MPRGSFPNLTAVLWVWALTFLSLPNHHVGPHRVQEVCGGLGRHFDLALCAAFLCDVQTMCLWLVIVSPFNIV